MNSAKHSIRREPSARRGWLSTFFGDDAAPGPQNARRRLIVAFAVAIAIHEIAAGFVPWRTQTLQSTPVERITIAKLTRIERRPTPTPKPTPSPKPVVHTKIVAPTQVKPRIVNPGHPSENHHVRRVASARPLVRTLHHSRRAETHVPMGGHGTGTSTKANPVVGGIGPGGNGAGESGNGAGTGGAAAAHEPCGAVYFVPTQDPRIDPTSGQVWEYVSIVVHFPDGTEQSIPLDYPFYYSSEAQDPFVKGNDNIPATFQFPPPQQRADEPPLVQYVIQHTASDGFTLLHDCPRTS